MSDKRIATHTARLATDVTKSDPGVMPEAPEAIVEEATAEHETAPLPTLPTVGPTDDVTPVSVGPNDRVTVPAPEVSGGPRTRPACLPIRAAEEEFVPDVPLRMISLEERLALSSDTKFNKPAFEKAVAEGKEQFYRMRSFDVHQNTNEDGDGGFIAVPMYGQEGMGYKRFARVKRHNEQWEVMLSRSWK